MIFPLKDKLEYILEAALDLQDIDRLKLFAAPGARSKHDNNEKKKDMVYQESHL